MDDEESIRYVCALRLQKAGFEVCLAEDGAEAVALYRSSLESGTRFAAVILDLNVPGRMGGLEAVRALRDLDPGVKAFVSSGSADDPAVLDHRAYGFAGVIDKPHFYLRKNLAEELERLLAAEA
jgi:CheY-like chemotaxis protein